MIMIIKFIFNLCNFSVLACVFSKTTNTGNLFSTAVNSAFVAKLLTSGILFLNSVSFASLAKSVTSGIFFSNSDLSVSYLVFKTKSLVSILFTFATSS